MDNGSRNAYWKIAPPVLVGLGGFLICLFKITTFDYWTNLALGRVFFEMGTSGVLEPFQKLTAPGVLDSTGSLFQRGLYLLHGAVGDVGISVAVALLAGLTAAALALGVRGREGGIARALGYSLILLIIFIGRERFAPRPEVPAMLLAALTANAGIAWRRAPSFGTLFTGAFLLALWAALHVSWAIGAAFFLLLVAMRPQAAFWKESQADARGRGRTVLSGFLAIVALAGIVDFGLKILKATGSGGALSFITEMLPIWNFPPEAAKFWSIGGFALLPALFKPRDRTANIIYIVLALAMGSLAARNYAMALLLIAPVALDSLEGFAARANHFEGAKNFGIVLPALTGILLLAVSIMAGDPPWGAGVEWDLFPREAAAFVKEKLPSKPVFNNFDIGGYLDWAWRGEPPTLIDGRSRGDARFQRDFRNMTDGVDAPLLLDKYDIKIAVTRATYTNSGRLFPIVEYFLTSPGWTLVNASDALVFTRAGSPGADAPLRARAGWEYVLKETEALGRIDPGRPHMPYTRAIARAALGDREGARREMAQALNAHPELKNYYGSLADALAR